MPDGDAGALAEQRLEFDRRGLAQAGDIGGERLAQRPGQLQTQRKQEIAARCVLAGELEFEDATVLTDRNVLHQVHLDRAPWIDEQCWAGTLRRLTAADVVINAFAQPCKRDRDAA
ncbi:hypothetical protein XOCgx_1495 [Xanthomonas oryzae pv. oryzicola]|nr:hypothetical protein XOCgx_1495 [Xanthomonas oryzae pv. oryzicola]